MSDLLRNNIQKSTYYAELQDMLTFEQVLYEMISQVKSTDPWVVGANGVPSSFFTCLYKFMVMRLTERQIYNMVRPDQLYTGTEFIVARNNPFVRCAGLLYIRYLSPPDQLWARLNLFLMENDENNKFVYTSDQRITTIGEFVRNLLEDKQFLG